MLVRIDLDQTIDDDLVGELQKGAVYASTKLASFRVMPDRRSATVECDEGADVEVTSTRSRWTRSTSLSGGDG
jgi:hypothetical protein